MLAGLSWSIIDALGEVSQFFVDTGLQCHLVNYLFYTLNIFLTSLAGTSVALLLSATVSVHTIATILTALIWVFMMVFSGLLVNVDTVVLWLRWLKWFSIFRYSMNVSVENSHLEHVGWLIR